MPFFANYFGIVSHAVRYGSLLSYIMEFANNSANLEFLENSIYEMIIFVKCN